MGDGSFNLFAGGNREVTLLRAKIRQLRIEILGTEYVMRGRGSRIVVMRCLGMETIEWRLDALATRPAIAGPLTS